jgi:hypothetical protein
MHSGSWHVIELRSVGELIVLVRCETLIDAHMMFGPPMHSQYLGIDNVLRI